MVDVVLWVFALFLAWVFIRVAVGVAETAAAVLLLTRRTAFAGAIIIVAIMIDAMGTHVYWDHPGQVTSEILPLFLATLVAIGRRKSFILLRPVADA